MTNEQEAEPAHLPVAPVRVREAAIAELARVATLVQEIPESDWKQASAASGWSIGDVVTHLNLALGLYRRVLEATLSGHGSGTAWRAFGRLTESVAPRASSALNAVNSALPRLVGSALAPEVVQGQFAAGARSLREDLESVGSADYTRPIHYMGRAWPLSFFLAWIVNELAVHGWDIESVRRPDAHLGEDARYVLPWLYWSGTSFMLRPPRPLSGTIQVTLADPASAMWWSLGGDREAQRVGESAGTDSTISGESGTFVLVLAGRINAEDALRATSLTIEGDQPLAQSFLRSWRLI